MSSWREMSRDDARRRVFYDERLGMLETRNGSTRWCAWRGRRLLERQVRPTRFLLSGTLSQPAPGLLCEVHRVLDGLGRIAAAAAVELEQRDHDLAVSDFHLSLIFDWDLDNDVLQLEFSPFGEPLLERDLVFRWQDERSAPQHQVVFRANPL